MQILKIRSLETRISKGADLCGVNFSNSWLTNGNFKGANLFQTDFDEELRVQCPSSSLGLASFVDGES